MKKNLIVDSSDINSPFLIRDYLYNEVSPAMHQDRPIIFLCIGSDRSTGDCLGPLIGSKLKYISRKNVHIYGTLDKPVHAQNLIEALNEINNNFINPYIIAIDACLGNIQNVGKIQIQKKALSPGAALAKALPSVGNLSILAVVNVSGKLDFMILQNTRLNTVFTLSEIIYIGIHQFILKVLGSNNKDVENIFI